MTGTDTDAFSLVGVTWAADPAVTDTVVQIRVQDDAGDWGDWTEVTVEDADQDAGTDDRRRRPRRHRAAVDRPEHRRRGRTGDPLRRRSPPTSSWTWSTRASSPADTALDSPDITDTADAATAMPPVYSRAQWGADETHPHLGAAVRATIKAATSTTPPTATTTPPPRCRRCCGRSTGTTRSAAGWGDIGYNVLADKFGRLWEGRYGGLASTVIGAHAGGFNTGTFGVSMLGNYDLVAPAVRDDQTPSRTSSPGSWRCTGSTRGARSR